MVDTWHGFRCLQGEPFGGTPDVINRHHTDGLFGDKIMESEIGLSNMISMYREDFVER